MKKFEYKTIFVPNYASHQAILDAFNEQGAEGWEPTGVTLDLLTGELGTQHLLKREIVS